MGYNTYLSLKNPLKDRVNIVLSYQNRIIDNKAILLKSIDEAIKYSKTNYPKKDIFFIGGRSIFLHGLNLCDELYITEIDKDFEGDVLLNLDLSGFKEVSSLKETEDNITFYIKRYTKDTNEQQTQESLKE